MESFIVTSIVVLFSMFFIILALQFINNKLKFNLLQKIIEMLSMIFIVGLFIFILCFLAGVFICTLIFLFLFIAFLISFILPKGIAMYLSIVINLIILAYFPEKLGYGLLKLIEKVDDGNRNGFSEAYKKLIQFIRPKLWIYFIAFILTLIASIEKINEVNIINYSWWISIKDYIIEAVVTFLAFDSFILLLESHYEKICNEINNIVKLIKDVFLSKSFED